MWDLTFRHCSIHMCIPLWTTQMNFQEVFKYFASSLENTYSDHHFEVFTHHSICFVQHNMKSYTEMPFISWFAYSNINYTDISHWSTTTLKLELVLFYQGKLNSSFTSSTSDVLVKFSALLVATHVIQSIYVCTYFKFLFLLLNSLNPLFSYVMLHVQAVWSSGCSL